MQRFSFNFNSWGWDIGGFRQHGGPREGWMRPGLGPTVRKSSSVPKCDIWVCLLVLKLVVLLWFPFRQIQKGHPQKNTHKKNRPSLAGDGILSAVIVSAFPGFGLYSLSLFSECRIGIHWIHLVAPWQKPEFFCLGCQTRWVWVQIKPLGDRRF